MEAVGAIILGLVPGLVLGYLAAIPRVRVLEKELVQRELGLAQEKE